MLWPNQDEGKDEDSSDEEEGVQMEVDVDREYLTWAWA